jgi:hypothetical protein
MRQFRLMFKPNATLLERRLQNGASYTIELHPDREPDARLLDKLVLNLGASDNDCQGTNRETDHTGR